MIDVETMPAAWQQIESFRLAVHLVNEGFNVIPLNAGGKKPATKWKRFQTEFATLEDLAEWFVFSDCVPAIVTGSISGITVVDCDSEEAVEKAGSLGLASGLNQETKRGRHFVFVHQGERNTVRMNGAEGIDRRGEGGYVKAYAESIGWTRAAVAERLEVELFASDPRREAYKPAAAPEKIRKSSGPKCYAGPAFEGCGAFSYESGTRDGEAVFVLKFN